MSWITCRAAETKDLPIIRTVLVDTWHETYDRLYGAAKVTDITNAWHSEAKLADQLAMTQTSQHMGHHADTSSFMVGLWDGRVVATSLARYMSGHQVVVDRLYVRGAYQGLGIGTALLNATVASLPRAQSLCLEVDPGNEDAIAFYKRLGFRKIREVSDCGNGGFSIRAHVYERILGEA
jgi:ribosomal protein S18 acetylase RimI-like enzyme